jgi:hypothetical protein
LELAGPRLSRTFVFALLAGIYVFGW